MIHGRRNISQGGRSKSYLFIDPICYTVADCDQPYLDLVKQWKFRISNQDEVVRLMRSAKNITEV